MFISSLIVFCAILKGKNLDKFEEQKILKQLFKQGEKKRERKSVFSLHSLLDCNDAI